MLIDCLIITIILGVVPVIEKYIVHYIEVETYIVLSGCLFFAYVLMYHAVIGHEKFYEDIQSLQQNKHLILLIIFSSFLFFIINNYLNLTLLKKNAAYLIAAITSSFPIFTAIFGVLLFNETVSFFHFIGIMFILLGVVFLNLSSNL
jgi:drug/metabolite transporter (DMT)-like permease